MRISKIELKNVKAFDGVVSLDFDEENTVFSISGKNGSGKSTLLKSAWLVQKAHFAILNRQLGDYEECAQDVARVLTSKDSYIKVRMTNDGEFCEIKLSSISDVEYNLFYENKDFIDSRWN
ncbi:MAG: AAA family ATPase [Rhodospirillales bacterium]|nr:AAA family ATPase [Rhodospirillales bacterium]